MTEDEIRNVIHEEAIRRYRLSGGEFIRQAQAGDVDEQCPGSDDLVALVRPLPETPGNL